MLEKYNKLKGLLAEAYDLNRASAVLSWDQQTYMPPKGAVDRGEQLATLSSLSHKISTSPEVGQLLDDLVPWVKTLDPDSVEACFIRRTKRDYDKETRVPAEYVAEFARVTTIGQETWVKARADSNFALFEPHLQKIVEMRRDYADFFKPYTHIYDPLLDDFEPGLKTAEVQAIFNTLRPQQVELLQAIAARPQVRDDFLHLNYPDKLQWEFGVEVVTRFGYDWEAGRQDRTAHPFSTTFSIGDVRITTRVLEDLLTSSMFSTMHEAGHAMYEQGVDPILARTVLADGASMAVHESQSRMWENLVGRSLPFWKYFYPRLKEIFPSQLGNVDLETFYKAVNKVSPSFIRVESDEATYNLHVMLRLELEIALIEGTLKVKDLPAAWNERMKKYIGVTPPNDRLGVLQDVHWSGGMIGYFPTYALGNLVSAQLWEIIHKDIPQLESQIERGEFSELLGWLRKNVHRHGAKYEPQDLIKRVTGSKIDPQPYMNYLRKKYGEIYGL